MTKAEIYSHPRLSPLAKLVARYLGERQHVIHTSAELGKSLGTMDGEISEASAMLRIAGVAAREHEGRSLPLSQLLLTPDAAKAFAPQAPKVEAKR